MSSDQDIREWAKAHGHERVTKSVREAYAAEHGQGDTSLEFQDATMPETVSERPPDVSGDNTATRVRTLVNRTKQNRRNRVKSPRTKTVHPRVSVERLIARGWEMIARQIAPINPPMARVLHMQAPIAGLVLEDEIKGTVVDKVLQPIARTEKKGEVVFGLAGPPVLVGILTAKPHLAPVLIPALRESLATWLDISEGKTEIIEERAKKFQEKYGERVDAIIEMILAPIEETPENVQPQ